MPTRNTGTLKQIIEALGDHAPPDALDQLEDHFKDLLLIGKSVRGQVSTYNITPWANPGQAVGHVWNMANQGGVINIIDAQIGAGGARNFQLFQTFKFLLANP